jgi:DNA-binding PadR family transcriptional regulator
MLESSSPPHRDGDEATGKNPSAHYRDQSSLSRDLLREIYKLQQHPDKTPYGAEIIALVKEDYRKSDTEFTDRSVIYERLTDLHESGLIKKHDVAEDGRKKSYVLTKHGEEILRQLREAYIESLTFARM